MKNKYPGLLVVITLAIVTTLLKNYFFDSFELITLGILVGILVANIKVLNESFKPGINFASKTLLNIGIIFMGVTLDFNLILDLGLSILILIVILIIVGFIFSNFLGKKMHLNAKLATLIGVGSTICGASAIIAIAPVIEADEDDISLAVAVISILGIVGIIVYSWVSTVLPISDTSYGIWAGSSLQGVSHALAAASVRGSDSMSLEVATLVKMSRVSLLAPVAFILSKIFAKNKKQQNVAFPKYVLYFILLGVIVSLNKKFNLVPTSFNVNHYSINILDLLKKASNTLILLSMIAMGLKTDINKLLSKGLSTLKLGIMVFTLLSLLSGSLIILYLQ